MIYFVSVIVVIVAGFVIGTLLGRASQLGRTKEERENEMDLEIDALKTMNEERL